MKRFLLLALCVLACPIKSIAADSVLLNSSAYILDHPNLSRKVSLALNDTNIVDALVYLSKKAEINVAVSKTVQGRATLSLNNVSIRDALDIILLSNELACEKRGEIFYVMPAADYETQHGEKWAEMRQVKIFKLRYGKPAAVAIILNMLKSKVGSVVVDEETGTLVVMDTNEKISQMKEAIDRQLDVKIKQVLIEAKIVRVKLTPAYEFGIDWEWLLSRDPATVESDFSFDSTSTKFGKIVVGKVSAGNIDGTLKLLKMVGETKLISSPHISVLNNEQAKIFIGTKEFYTQTTTTVNTGTPTTAVAVAFIDVGVQLQVTPVINDDGFILMKIRPEISRVDRTVTIDTGDKIPVVDTTNAETRVMVKDGKTIIIGGLIKNETQCETEKFPVLSDIPLIGNLFKHVREDKDKTELVVFLTPHIISGDEDMTQFDAKKTKPMRGYDDHA